MNTKNKNNFNELLERVKGIEPSYAAWEAAVLPLNYTRIQRLKARFAPNFKRIARA